MFVSRHPRLMEAKGRTDDENREKYYKKNVMEKIIEFP